MLILGLGPAAAAGVEVVLRPQATPGDSIVRLGAIADVTPGRGGVAGTAAEEALAAELAAVPLMPAPAAGTQAYLTAAQVRDLLTAGGVDVRSLAFRGAATVAIAAPAVDQPPTPADAVAPQQPTRERVAQELAQAIVAYLQQRTGHDLWNVEVTPDNDVVDAYWHFGSQLAIAGGQAPWTGRQRFAVTAPGLDKRVLAFAAVERVEMVVFAVRPIARGDFVRATDVALQSYTGVVPATAAASLADVVGKEAVQAVRAGAMLTANQVRAPLLVRRGERVIVRARAAGVTVRTYATAQQDGSLGELIAVQAIDGKDRYAARVSGVRELEVLAIGASAGEIAASGK
jgi:flagella basal body P-ring formation protein FlgA